MDTIHSRVCTESPCDQDWPQIGEYYCNRVDGPAGLTFGTHVIQVSKKNTDFIELDRADNGVLVLCAHALRHATKGRVQASQFNLMKGLSPKSQPR